MFQQQTKTVSEIFKYIAFFLNTVIFQLVENDQECWNFRSVHMMILRSNFRVTHVVGCGGFFQQLYFSVNKPFLPTMERITTTKSKMFQPTVK